MSWPVSSITGQLFFYDGKSYGRESVEEFIGEQFDYVITVCDNAKESSPVFPGNAVRMHQVLMTRLRAT